MLGNRTKSVPKIKTFTLCVTFCNQYSFVPFNSAICFELDLINPFSSNRTFVLGRRSQFPCVIVCQSLELIGHSILPVGDVLCLNIGLRLKVIFQRHNKSFICGRQVCISYVRINGIADGRMISRRRRRS